MVPFWCYNGTIMTVSLSIKSVPGDLAEELRQQAARHHRSVQGELLHILESALRPQPFRAGALWRQLEALEFKTAATAAGAIRRDRDRR